MTAEHHERAAPIRVVVRVFDTSWPTRSSGVFSIHAVRSTSALAAPWVRRRGAGYDVLSTFYTERSRSSWRGCWWRGAALDGVLLSELTPQVRVVALVSEGEIVPRPTRYTRLAAGEQLLLVGPPREVIASFRRTSRLMCAGGASARVRMGPGSGERGACLVLVQERGELCAAHLHGAGGGGRKQTEVEEAVDESIATVLATSTPAAARARVGLALVAQGVVLGGEDDRRRQAGEARRAQRREPGVSRVGSAERKLPENHAMSSR